MSNSKTPTQIAYAAHNNEMEKAIVKYLGMEEGELAIQAWRARTNPVTKKTWRTYFDRLIEMGLKEDC